MANQAAVSPIHPDVLPRLDQAFVELYNQHLAHTPAQAPDLAILRKIYSTQFSYAFAPAPECAKEYEDEVDGWERYPGKIKIRVYIPHGSPPEKGWPVHVDFHGGGWALGDLETEAHVLRHICVNASIVAIDIDYRLLPEYPFPTAIYDSFSALETISTSPSFAKTHNIDSTSISLGGFSAGANIALVLDHLSRDHKPHPIPIKAVIACMPVLADVSNLADPSQSPYPSSKDNAYAPTLNWPRLKWFDALKTSSLKKDTPQDVEDISWFLDAFTALNYTGLADLTYVATAGCDPLRDEGEAYAKLLQGSGNKVILRRFEGVPHPFQHMDGVLSQARELIVDACRYVRDAHYGK